jgi:hypothetical protein
MSINVGMYLDIDPCRENVHTYYGFLPKSDDIYIQYLGFENAYLCMKAISSRKNLNQSKSLARLLCNKYVYMGYTISSDALVNMSIHTMGT